MQTLAGRVTVSCGGQLMVGGMVSVWAVASTAKNRKGRIWKNRFIGKKTFDEKIRGGLKAMVQAGKITP